MTGNNLYPLGMTPEPLYTAKEVASMLRVHQETVYVWVRSGKLEAFQPAKHGPIRISATELRRLGYPA